MKIYIATPVNGRKEKTLEEKQKAAGAHINYCIIFNIKCHYI